MRRYLAGALLILMVTQSAGTAIAGTQNSSSDGPTLAAVINPVWSVITGSRLYAVATGTADRYDAMHAPAPLMRKVERDVDGPALMRSRQVLRPQLRPGTPEPPRLPPRDVLIARDRAPDPRAMRPSAVKSHPAESNTFTPLGAERGSVAATPQRSGSMSSSPLRRGAGAKRALATSGGTGIEHWWTYEEQPIPGIGKALLNVGTGNLLVSAMDVNVPEQGIDLAFQRVYNSQSLHDANGDDGGEPAIFGNAWTNNFDASIVYNGTSGTITVYNLDGTACTYTSNGNGGWIPCTGEYAQLAVVSGSQGCQYSLTKPNGTIYVFETYGGSGSLCTAQNLTGHLVEILGRNNTNTIAFTYYWDSSGIRTSEHITEVDADHSDGDKLVMRFGLIGKSINELGTITRPDQSVLQYWYDTSGDLVEVDKPGNNAAWNLPDNPHKQWQQGDLPETYAYVSGTDQMQEACGPRCTAAMWANSSSPADGAALLFTYSNSQLVQWQVQGVLNFTPDDQTGVALQGNKHTGWQTWNTTTFQYGSSGQCGTGGSSTTYMCDLDGHATIWTTDSSDRVTKTKRFAVNQWIVTYQSWDTSNNLVSTTDANGNVTQYGYDQSGNMVETQLPSANDFTIRREFQPVFNAVELLFV